jgi:tetratricopeptide (TPR) repeat protein
MTNFSPNVQKLIRESRAVVEEGRVKQNLARAWGLLQERDADGNVRGSLPYTGEALREFATAHKADPEDVNAIHHLAIAHHARAWDMELHGIPQAVTEWEQALGYWRNLVSSPSFWVQQKGKLLACDPEADPGVLDGLRENLLENLLDIHVGFIRYYSERELSDRASAHVDLIRRSVLPPAVKKRLIGKVFEAMTGAARDAKAAQEYAGALASLERFLSVFSGHLMALQLYAEVCEDWLSHLSYQDDWDDILALGQRAEPHIQRLADHKDVDETPTARMALEELARGFVLRCLDRGQSYNTAGLLSITDRDAARAAYAWGVLWGRLGYPHSPRESRMRKWFASCANGYAFILSQEANEVGHSQADRRTKKKAVERLLSEAIAALEEAAVCDPDEDVITKNLETLTDNLNQLKIGGY